MILAIDIGNTTVAFSGVVRKDGDYQVTFAQRTDTIVGKSVSFYMNDITRELKKNGFDTDDFEGAVLSSVVPSITPRYKDALTKLLGKSVVIIDFLSDTGLTMDVDEPERVGNDRIVDSAWVASRYPLPAVTVDMGTATTFNCIDKGGIFRGGAIAPGLETGLWALSRRAAQLPETLPEIPEKAIGRNTRDCMETGAVLGSACLVDELTRRFEEELGESVTLVLTGGLSKYISSLCRHSHVYDPYLLVKGLAYLYDRNIK